MFAQVCLCLIGDYISVPTFVVHSTIPDNAARLYLFFAVAEGVPEQRYSMLSYQEEVYP
jgi:hypothetical protein